MADAGRKPKRGPDPERLKIENPEEALRKLLTVPQPKPAEEEPEEGEEPQDG